MDQDKALERTKISLMTSGSVFLVTLALNLPHYFDESIPTADTNGTRIRYNPQFFMRLSEERRLTLMVHEVWHVGLLHMQRRGDREPEKYNRAADFVINQLCKDAGLEPIPGWLQDDQYKDMSTNQVYDMLPDEPPQNNLMAGDIEEPKGDEEDTVQVTSEIEQLVIQAQVQSEMSGDKQGDLPAELRRHIEKLLNPALPWEEILGRFMQDQAKDDYSWRRPNKRFMPDFYMPSMHSERLEHLTFAIDTSGSVTKDDMVAMLTEINYIKEVMNPQRMTILDCDTVIHNVYDVTESESILDLEFTGGGGTKCAPVIEYCEQHHTTALVYFTDLFMSEYPHPIAFPLLWIVYNNPNRTHVNIGEITHYDIKGSK